MTSKSRRTNHKPTVADWLLLISLIIASGYSFIFIKDVMPQGTEVKIEAGGKLAYVLPLSIHRTVSVDGPLGRTFIEIYNGRVRVKDSPCHNKLCMHEGWINRGAIVCLPNRVLVIISGPADKRGIDGITG